MDFEKYTDRAKGFVQAAQSLALREGHQQFGPDHLLKVLLDDPEGMAAGLIQRAGGRPGDALAAVEQVLAKRPKVSGGGAGQIYLAPELARVFDTRPEDRRQGRRQVRHRRAAAAGAGHGVLQRRRPRPEGCRRHADHAQPGHQRHPQGPHRRQRLGRAGLRRAQALCPRPDRGGRRGQDRSRHRPRRGDPPHHPGAVPAHQEQSRPDRRARRRQDGHRRGPGPAHRQGRCAREPEGQEAAGARHGLADRRAPNTAASSRSGSRPCCPRSRPRAAGSSCSSTSCTPSSAPARPRARWTPATCSSPRWRAASCTASAPPRSTNTASTSRRTPPWRGASSRSSSPSRRWRTPSPSCAA